MNIYDIAKKAGVSITTVSRVINNKGYVNENTKKKIQEVMELNEYQPSAIARGLATGSMKTVAVVVADVRIPHYALTSYSMERKLTENGYMVTFCNIGEDKDSCKRYLRMLGERKVDGIILVGSVFNHLCDEESLSLVSDIPIIMANGRIERNNIYYVLVDETHGMELATRHIYERGKRKIAYVKDRECDAGQRKLKGFIQEMRCLGYIYPEHDVYKTSYGLEGGMQIAEELYQKGYEGVVFAEDLTAVGALNHWTEMGLKIPEDMALVGYNNSEYSYVCNPGLTTVDNKGEVLSELTVKLFLDVINKKQELATLVILPELKVRKTT